MSIIGGPAHETSMGTMGITIFRVPKACDAQKTFS
jgi:hypothetical protein